MYFVDRKKINDVLEHMDELLALFLSEKGWRADKLHELALERLAHVVIEMMIDVGNAMIDGFIMRDPGSYEDIIDIMEDERVITTEMAEPLKRVIELRKMIIRDFVTVDLDTVEKTLNESMEELRTFPGKVRDYLENELGPVSAFLPEEK
ncbi:DUF86 domain-containing protein [Filibacter tadaridae]|uniref:DUF86 domain-containing protein n=1 Tax=Filibacter tadaridae TaxID=2483811 RepID=A0A3P5XV32_9BACL|nr:DUF86 domain-containing protein [Filibacter tadaridae]VDC31951.1 hypothetical protein FILTAD_02526 [Filibacter tadaridae]